MTVLRLTSSYDPSRVPVQVAFRKSRATMTGYGGAMAGGKTRSITELAWDWALEYPGIYLPIFRQLHTSIVDTTRRTFMEQVLPPELRGRPDLVQIVGSGGKDFVKLLWNGSEIHFVGLDNPGKIFSAEFGGALFDEAHEMDEDDIITAFSRVRQKCVECTRNGWEMCDHMPHRMIFAFNPADPSHWLYRWFMTDFTPTDWGTYKKDLILEGASEPLGDAEFFRAYATDNPFLPPGYVERNLAGMKEPQKRRFLMGMWEYISGSGFFDQDALSRLADAALETKPIRVAETAGDPLGDQDSPREKLGVREHKQGRLYMFADPLGWGVDRNGNERKPHRYIVAVDASSGASADFSACQVIDVETFTQVAEWQGKVDPDKLATVAFTLAKIYNGAEIVPEVTGGWGFAVVKKIQYYVGHYEGQDRPRLYTRRVIDRLSNTFTDMLGWDTTTKTRANMLAICEEAIRDGSLIVHGQRTLAELSSFVIGERSKATNEYRSPRARSGSHDDLVIALAIGVAVASDYPRHNKRKIGGQTFASSGQDLNAAGF